MSQPNQNPPVPPVQPNPRGNPPPPLGYMPVGGPPQQGGAMSGLIPYKNAPALIGYYLGVFSILPGLGLLLGIAAVVLGIIGLMKVKANPAIRGTGHAITAIICGSIFGLGWLVLGVMLILAR